MYSFIGFKNSANFVDRFLELIFTQKTSGKVVRTWTYAFGLMKFNGALCPKKKEIFKSFLTNWVEKDVVVPENRNLAVHDNFLGKLI